MTFVKRYQSLAVCDLSAKKKKNWVKDSNHDWSVKKTKKKQIRVKQTHSHQWRWKKKTVASDHPVVICALIQQLVLVSQKGATLRATHIPFYGLISRRARGAVRSRSLIGEHMSGPICHWFLWEWHQWWPLDPRWRRNASEIVFHYRGERARADIGKWENRRTGKGI